MSNVVAQQSLLPVRSRAARLFGFGSPAAENRSLYRGALGELLVGDALDNLGPAWDALHAVPVDADGDDLDHVAIGPPGVFTLLTRNHTGEDVVVDGESILVAGRPLDHIATARTQAATAAALLTSAAGRPVSVAPLVVIVNPAKLVIRRQPAGLTVISSRFLERWLGRLDRRLDGPEVAFISDVADRATTWCASPTPDQDTMQLHRDFSLLRAEVNTATRRRALWSTLAFLLACGFMWGSVALMVARIIRL